MASRRFEPPSVGVELNRSPTSEPECTRQRSGSPLATSPLYSARNCRGSIDDLVDRGRPLRAGHVEADRPLRDAPDEPLGLEAVLDEVGDREDGEPVLLGEALEVGHPRHRAVVVHDLADDAGRVHARQAREVDGALGLAGAHEHAAAARPEGEDVARRHEVRGARVGADGDLDGLGAIGGADARGHAVPRLDADGEGGAEGRPAPARGRHHRQLQAGHLLLLEREADEAAAVRGHEVDGLRRDGLRGEAEVALVLAILVVDEDHHLARSDAVERGVHPLEDGGVDGQAVRHVVRSVCGRARSRALVRPSPPSGASRGGACRRRAAPPWRRRGCACRRGRADAPRSARARRLQC